MQHVAFYEPRYDARHPDIWAIRGGNKYPSIIGRLPQHARISIIMGVPPPADNPHRLRLESEFCVRFVDLHGPDLPHPELDEEVARHLVDALTPLGATVLSNLNGRSVGFCYSMARAAQYLGIRYVYRLAGNDIEARTHISSAMGRPISGTAHYEGMLRQARMALHLATKVIVMSRRELNRVKPECVDPGKVAVCFRGVDQVHFNPGPTPRNGPCRKFLFVGRRSSEKGYDILERAAEQLAQAAPEVTVSFAGTFEKSTVSNRRYLGFIGYGGLPALYGAHDALVVCSRSEGFPQVVMEAMSMGLPCILTSELFRHDFVDDENCLLAEAAPEPVYLTMLRLAGDDQLYRRLAANTLAWAKRMFSDVENNNAYRKILLGE